MKVGDLTFDELRSIAGMPPEAAVLVSNPERIDRFERAGIVKRPKVGADGYATAEVTVFGHGVAAASRCFLEDPLYTITELVDVLEVERDALRKEVARMKDGAA